MYMNLLSLRMHLSLSLFLFLCLSLFIDCYIAGKKERQYLFKKYILTKGSKCL